MKVRFEEEELMVIAFFEYSTKRKTLLALRDILPYIEDDPEILPIVAFAIEKLNQISEEEFKELDLASYKEEPEAVET